MKAEYLDHMGDDLAVVNNARVSFDKESKWENRCLMCEAAGFDSLYDCQVDARPSCQYGPVLSLKDEKLIYFLARGCSTEDYHQLRKAAMLLIDGEEIDELISSVRRMHHHWTPFANGIQIKFRVTAPIPIMRQVYKHKVGVVENEVSRRYVDGKPVFEYPEWRENAEDRKQGSGGPITDCLTLETMNRIYAALVDHSEEAYRKLLHYGACPEQARYALLQGMQTTSIVTNSLYGWSEFYKQRTAEHAQQETAELARQVAMVCRKHFPVSWDALLRN